MLYLLMIVIMGVSWYISWALKKRFKEYSEMPINLTGREVAEKMLNENHVTDNVLAFAELLQYRINQIKTQAVLIATNENVNCKVCGMLLGKLFGKYEITCPECGSQEKGSNFDKCDELPPCFDCRPNVFRYCSDTGTECKRFLTYCSAGKNTE